MVKVCSLLFFLATFNTIVYSDDLKGAKFHMIQYHLKGRDISDSAVLSAFEKVPRELFVLPSWKSSAYEDNPLPIGEGQTISQPYVVALMTQRVGVKHGDKVLEIGTGSGYQAAILRTLTPHVYSIEIRKKLTEFATSNLKNAGFLDVHLKTDDGYFGWEKFAPFDVIMITCAANHIPPPLKKQLKVGGKLILPLGSTIFYQSLILIKREAKDKFSSETLTDVSFVPMTGRAEKLQPTPNHNKKSKKEK